MSQIRCGTNRPVSGPASAPTGGPGGTAGSRSDRMPDTQHPDVPDRLGTECEASCACGTQPCRLGHPPRAVANVKEVAVDVERRGSRSVPIGAHPWFPDDHGFHEWARIRWRPLFRCSWAASCQSEAVRKLMACLSGRARLPPSRKRSGRVRFAPRDRGDRPPQESKLPQLRPNHHVEAGGPGGTAGSRSDRMPDTQHPGVPDKLGTECESSCACGTQPCRLGHPPCWGTV